MKPKRRKTADHPIYDALSRALGECLPLPRTLTVHIPFDAFVRLRGELAIQARWSLHRIPFDHCPIQLDLWKCKISVYPK